MGNTKELFSVSKIEKRNVLNEIRSNNMTLQELRFFSIYLSKINARDISTRVVRFPLSDFQRIMEFGKLNLAQIRATTNSLLQKIVNVPNPKTGGYTAFQLFKECTVDQDELGEWYVEIDAHDKALPLMFDFKREYFTYELWNALRLKSVNQLRVYEILKQYENIGSRELTIAELRKLLYIGENEYSGRTGWSDFKKRILDSCQKALEENTDICFTYERGKIGKGGKWLTIIFHIKKNNNYKDQLTLAEFIAEQPEPDVVIEIDDNQVTFDDVEVYEDRKYSNNHIAFLAEACENEFDNEEMIVIADELHSTVASDDELEQYNHLKKAYDKLLFYAKDKKITNRMAYLLKILSI